MGRAAQGAGASGRCHRMTISNGAGCTSVTLAMRAVTPIAGRTVRRHSAERAANGVSRRVEAAAPEAAVMNEATVMTEWR